MSRVVDAVCDKNSVANLKDTGVFSCVWVHLWQGCINF